jgi:hypothetical protein
MSKSRPRRPSFIDPDRLYTLQGFIADSGISATRMREARRQGVKCTMLTVGRRKFIRGPDAIAYIERLAELDQPTRENTT